MQKYAFFREIIYLFIYLINYLFISKHILVFAS